MSIETQDWEQIKDLFGAAVEMEPAARSRFLEQECSSPQMRERVERLLLAHESADSFLSRNVIAEGAWEPDSIPPRLTAGDVLVERFQIVRFIARGGMGEVYEACDLELQSRVAVKTIQPQIANLPQALARFKREVLLAKQVTHPNVCRIFDLFRHRDTAVTGSDIVFVSMELLSGETLAEQLKRTGRMSTEQVLVILGQIVPALGAAHAAGILHRDLKPGNILLERISDGGIRAVITDFGLAWSRDSRSEASLAGSGALVFGTPEYMSPEQIEGKELTPASDLYSLGLVIYQMVTGVKAFGTDSPLFAALRRLNESPPPPSQVVPEAGSRWDFLVTRCLCPDPAQRFASADQFAAALDWEPETGKETASKTPPAAGKGKPAARGWRSMRRWKLASCALGGAIVLAGVVLLGLHSWHRPGPGDDLTIVLADFVNTTGEPVFDDSLNIALAAKLQQSPYARLMQDSTIHTALHLMGRPDNERLTQAVAREVCIREGGQFTLQGSITNSSNGYLISLHATQCGTGKIIATKQFSASSREAVLGVLDRATDAMRSRLGESKESIHDYDVSLVEATTGSLEALTSYSQGMKVWDVQGAPAARPYFERATDIDPNFAMAYAVLGTIYGNMSEKPLANDAMLKAYERRERVTQWENFYIASHYYWLVTGELDKEMHVYEEWAKIYPHDFVWQLNLSVDYAYIGEYEKAIQLQRNAIQKDANSSLSYGNLANLYLAINRPDEARAVLDQAIQAHVQDVHTQIAEYNLAFYLNDRAAMSKLMAGTHDKADVEGELLLYQANTEDSQGRLTSGRHLTMQAAGLAAKEGNFDNQAFWLAAEALSQAESGDAHASRQLMEQSLAVPKALNNSGVQIVVAFVAAYIGDVERAKKMTDTLDKAYPRDTIIQSYWVPILRARTALTQGQPAEAVHLLDGTEVYDLGNFSPGQCMDATYVHGLSSLAERDGAAAANQFRNVLAHRGLVLNCPTGALSQLGLARALALSGDTSGSRAAYQDLFALWKDANQGFRLLQQARVEYRALR